MPIVSICRESGIDWDQVPLDTKKHQTGGTLWDIDLLKHTPELEVDVNTQINT